MNPVPSSTDFSGLDLLSTAVMLIDDDFVVRHLNAGAESLFGISASRHTGLSLATLLGDIANLVPALHNALDNNWSYTSKDLRIVLPGHLEPFDLDCTVNPVEAPGVSLLL